MKMNMHSKKAVLFDLDGVLIDSINNMKYAWEASCVEFKLNIPFELYKSRIGKPFNIIMKELGLERNAIEIELFFKRKSAETIELIEWMPSAKELLNELYMRGVKVGVVTSKDLMRTHAILCKSNIEFTTIQTPNKNMRGKPAPDHILAAVIECKVDIDDVVFIGDMDVDCEAARRAGVEYIHYSNGYGEDKGYENMVNDLVELMCVIK